MATADVAPTNICFIWALHYLGQAVIVWPRMGVPTSLGRAIADHVG